MYAKGGIVRGFFSSGRGNASRLADAAVSLE